MELEKMQPLDLSEESTPVEEVTLEEMPEVSVSSEAAPEVVTDSPTEEPSPVPEADSPAEEETPSDVEEEEETEVQEYEEEYEEEESDQEAQNLRIRRRNIRRRRARRALRYYIALFATFLGILVLLCCAMIPFKSWLTDFEASQTYHMESQIYDLLFKNPDWSLLYDMADVQPTQFEGRDEYVEYMTGKVGDQPLTCVEVATGMADYRLFSVRLGNEEIATYTMVPANEETGLFRPWTLGEVDVFFTREQSVTVIIMPGQTVYINGIPLDENYTTLRVSTLAEEYLPEGLHGFRYEQQEISGLLVDPVVDVLDEYNNPVPLTRDEATGVYSVEVTRSTPIVPARYEMVIEAAKAEVLFSIRAINVTQLRQHFSPNSEAYADIVAMDPIDITYKEYTFDDVITTVKDYYLYSPNLFSVRVNVVLNIIGHDNSVTTLETNITYFCQPNATGNFTISQRLEEDLQQEIHTVPVTYLDEDYIYQVDWVATTAESVTSPTVDGSLPLFWAKMEADGTYTNVLEVQSDGTCLLLPDMTWEAMELYPIFDEDTL